MGGNGNYVFKEIPTSPDSYQIYNNLLIALTLTVTLAGY